MLDVGEMQNTPKTKYAKDYQPPAFFIDKVDLEFDLHPTETRVTATLACRRNGEHDHALILNGEQVELLSLAIDEKVLAPTDYDLGDDALCIANVADQFSLQMECQINPQANTELSGLYLSGGNFCTQCEAEGFRRIIYFPDRPDILSRYSVVVRADKNAYPVLLSNGNPESAGQGDDGRHWAKWDDPHPKPSYLFALVAGDLKAYSDQFTTSSGRNVDLHIYVAEHDLPKCGHAMASLKQAMRWDEDVYGLEYDLDVYNIVAVSDFNMGAMENKGLNVFNTRYVLASPDTATDQDYDGVEGVIAHEYFHNWTGNRVTCRDWFQLSLKEGLTVFRDQEFSADQGSRAVKRIEDVRVLRAVQFPEDRGPMAHPVRPESYIEINNFYTPTVYNKGAEVIRMMHGILGADGFRRGMDLYFERHDGQAVTCDDFVAAMADAGDVDLDHFKLWYAQAGTPHVKAECVQDHAQGTLTLTLRQSLKATPGQSDKSPMLIPLKTGFISRSGEEVTTVFQGVAATEHMVMLSAAEQSFEFSGVKEDVLPSLLRGFSAPVELEIQLDKADLKCLAQFDSDPFNRWEAMQRLAIDEVLGRIEKPESVQNSAVTSAIEATLDKTDLDPAFIAEALTLPSEAVLGDHMKIVDVEALFDARKALRRDVLAHLKPKFLDIYRKTASQDDKGARKLKNVLLGYLTTVADEEMEALAFEQFQQAQNMTDESAAFACLIQHKTEVSEQAVEAFYAKWREEPLVLDKWFSIQATTSSPNCLDIIDRLVHHEDYNRRNPNRVRSLVSAFSFANQRYFHDASGKGYAFLKDEVLKVDQLNPQTAARLLAPLGRWRRFDESRAALMRDALRQIVDTPGLSKDVFEIASKSLV